MKKLDKLLYAADKIEPTRGFDSSELIASMLDDVDQGFVTVLKANIEYFKSKGLDYHNLTDPGKQLPVILNKELNKT